MCDEINSSCPPVTPPWEPPQVIPAQMRRVNNLIFRKINQFHRENEVEDVTPMHEWILSYLFWHRDEPVYQRDIEREFSITRSTVTNILQLMERKGYIERQSVPCSPCTRPTNLWRACSPRRRTPSCSAC